jgi:hypothetical protein
MLRLVRGRTVMVVAPSGGGQVGRTRGQVSLILRTYGDSGWVRGSAVRLSLESTLRPSGVLAKPLFCPRCVLTTIYIGYNLYI